MDTELLVEDQIEAGREFLDQLARNDIDVIAACWAKTSEEGRWFLYIASGDVDKKGLAAAYRDILGVLGSIPDTPISMFEVIVIGKGNPIAKDLLAIQQHPATGTYTRSSRRQIGSLAVREVYSYPPPGAVTRSPRVSLSVTYHRQGDSDRWAATTEFRGRYEDINFKGVVSYSTAFWAGEREEDQKFAIVSVLLEIDPEIADADLLNRPDIRKMLLDQARLLADERFKSRHPNAEIEHREDDE